MPTLLISKRVEDVPFDYRHRCFILYNTDLARWEERLSSALEKTIGAILSEAGMDAELPWPYDTRSPVDVDKLAMREQRLAVAKLMDGIDYQRAAQGLVGSLLSRS